LLALAGPARAAPAHPSACLLVEHKIDHSFALPQTARAIGDRKLSVLVVGAGSSTLPGPNGGSRAYPARLQAALQAALPGVAVTVAIDVKSRRTAADMVKSLAAPLAAARPA